MQPNTIHSNAEIEHKNAKTDHLTDFPPTFYHSINFNHLYTLNQYFTGLFSLTFGIFKRRIFQQNTSF